MKRTLPLLIAAAVSLLTFSCTIEGNDTSGDDSGPSVRKQVKSIQKSYTLSFNQAVKNLAKVSVTYVDADGKTVTEQVNGLSWSKKGIKTTVSGKATAVPGSTAGLSVSFTSNNPPANQVYHLEYQAGCTYDIVYEDGSTAQMVAWDIEPEMPAVESKNVDEACNSISLSCTNDKQIVVDNQGNIRIDESGYWEDTDAGYTPPADLDAESLAATRQEPPTTSPDPDSADGPEAVDLGFTVTGRPLKWAVRNVGARTPGDFGGLYGWGDASGYHTETNPVFYPARNPKDIVGDHNNSISGTRCDLAYSQWGRKWRIPSKAEWEALAANCEWEKVKVDGNWGFRFTSKKNGKSIFLPGADARYGSNLYRDSKSPENCYGYYWAGDWCSTDAQFAYHFFFQLWSNNVYSKCQIKDRYFGMSIRPVTD